MKKVLWIALCLLLTAALSVSVLAVELSAELTPDKTKVNYGDSVVVTVSIGEFASCKSGALRITFDSEVFERTESAWLLDNMSMSTADGDAVFALNNATTLSGDIYQFTLKVKDNAAFGDTIISAKLTLRDSGGTATTVDAALAVTVACNHSYSDWSKQNDSKHIRACSACGTTETKAHSWGDGEVTKSNGCDQPGEMTYTCADCGATKTETIAATDHVWDGGKVTKAATCVETGIRTYTCASCKTTKTETIPLSTGHTYGSWKQTDSTSHTRECSVCKKTESASHHWDSGKITKTATCAAEGEKTYTCADCGDTKTETVVKLTTHTYDNNCDGECNVCGNTRTPSHKYRDTWSSDSSGHWHACSVCGDRKDETAHTPGPAATEWEAQTCTTCGYTIRSALGHTHKYGATYTTDEEGHWYACSGCEEKISYAEHYFRNNCTTTCSICGYVREIEHDYSDRLSYDATGHWHACTVCGDVLEKEPHTPGPEATETTDQICQDCGFVIQTAQSHVHTPNGDLLANEDGHWNQCACGEKIDEAGHTWDSGTEDPVAGVKTFLCTVCGYSHVELLPEGPQEPTLPAEPTTPEETTPDQPGTPGQVQQPGQTGQQGGTADDGNTPGLAWWWYVIIAVCVLLLGAVIFVIIGILVSRKQVGKFSPK